MTIGDKGSARVGHPSRSGGPSTGGRVEPRDGRRRQTEEDKSLARLKRALRKAERRAGDGSDIGGTGATILKLLPAPLARLADKGRIGTEEIRAADDIAVAFHAQAGALLIKPPCLERRDASHHGREPIFVIDAVSRYKHWANHSMRSTTCRSTRPTSRRRPAPSGGNTTSP